MKCQRCSSERVGKINGKSSDLNNYSLGEKSGDGYVPYDWGIGGGDYYSIKICLDCGQVQGEFPRPLTALEEGEEE